MKIRALLVGLVAMGLSAGAMAADPVVIKFSHVVADNTPKGKGAIKFKELAEKYTNGAAKVEVYANSTLYKDKEEMEALQLGAVQMIAPSLAKFGPLGVRTFEVFDLPYIFDSYDDLHKVTTGALGQKFLSSLEPKGIKGLAFWDNGFKVMSANKSIRVPDDYKGMKMRALGALPQVMAFSEVYQALQTGVVDGTENPPSNLYTQKMHEVQKYVANTNHGYLGYAVITNKKFWEGLPDDLRGQLEKAMAEATVYANDIAKQENETAMAEVKKSGKSEIIDLTADEKKAMKKALVSVHKDMASRIGQELIDAVYKETGFDPSKL